MYASGRGIGYAIGVRCFFIISSLVVVKSLAFEIIFSKLFYSFIHLNYSIVLIIFAPIMDELDFEILDAIYFVEPFNTILKEVSEKRIGVVKECLRNLIRKRWVQVMVWNETRQEMASTAFYDYDKMEDFHFLATKEGLMAHNRK